jgi:hypothetical protein
MMLNRRTIEALIESGHLLECKECLELSTRVFNLVTARSGFYGDAKPGEIAYVSKREQTSWTCRHCRAENHVLPNAVHQHERHIHARHLTH